MNCKILFVALVGVLALGCNEKKTEGSETTGATTAAAKEPDCDAVVAKMLSFQPGSGEPEKKLLTKMCPGMPVAMKSCVVEAKTKDDYDKCSKLGAGKPIQLGCLAQKRRPVARGLRAPAKTLAVFAGGARPA